MTTNVLQLGAVPIEVNKLVTNKLDYHIMENINDKEETKALSQDVVIGCLDSDSKPVVVTSQSGNTLITVTASYNLVTKSEKIKVLALMSAWISDELNSH